MNIGILLALMAFLAFRGNGSSSKVADPKNGLAGYTGFAYFPLFAPALPMEDDVPTDYPTDWLAWVQTLKPKNYYLVKQGNFIYVYERTDWNRAVQRGVYNPDLRMKVVDGVPETAEASE